MDTSRDVLDADMSAERVQDENEGESEAGKKRTLKGMDRGDGKLVFFDDDDADVGDEDGREGARMSEMSERKSKRDGERAAMMDTDMLDAEGEDEDENRREEGGMTTPQDRNINSKSKFTRKRTAVMARANVDMDMDMETTEGMSEGVDMSAARKAGGEAKASSTA